MNLDSADPPRTQGVDRMERRSILPLILAAAFLAAPPAQAGVKIGFLGDQGYGEKPRKVLRMLRAEGIELLVILGDFDYKHRPDRWDEML